MQPLWLRRFAQLLKRGALLALVALVGSGVFFYAFVYSALVMPGAFPDSTLGVGIRVLIAAAVTAFLFSHALVALTGRYAYVYCLVIPGGFIFFTRQPEIGVVWLMCAVLALVLLLGIWLVKKRSNLSVKRDAPPASRLRAPYLQR